MSQTSNYNCDSLPSISQQKTVTTNTVEGSSSSSSQVTRTFITTSTSVHSQSSSNQFAISKNIGNTSVREAIKRIDQFSVNHHPSNKIVSTKKEDNNPFNKSNTVPKLTADAPFDKSQTGPKSTADNYEKFQLDCLNAHNIYRRKHSVGPLKLSPALNDFAQNWANTIAKRGQLQHSSEKKYGENIYWSSGKTVNGNDPVDSWYDEIKQYNYKNASFSSGTGHFTQVVWKNSCELGVGMACVGNEVYVVASYYPPGNYSGEFSKNVLPSK